MKFSDEMVRAEAFEDAARLMESRSDWPGVDAAFQLRWMKSQQASTAIRDQALEEAARLAEDMKHTDIGWRIRALKSRAW